MNRYIGKDAHTALKVRAATTGTSLQKVVELALMAFIEHGIKPGMSYRTNGLTQIFCKVDPELWETFIDKATELGIRAPEAIEHGVGWLYE